MAHEGYSNGYDHDDDYEGEIDYSDIEERYASKTSCRKGYMSLRLE